MVMGSVTNRGVLISYEGNKAYDYRSFLPSAFSLQHFLLIADSRLPIATIGEDT